MRNLVLVIALFSGSVALGLVISAPNVALSEVRTVAGGACIEVTNTISRCSMPIGSVMSTSTISSGYFDYTTYASQTVTIGMYKQTYFGGNYADYKNVTCSGTCDSGVPLVNVKTNASQFDYLLGQIVFAQPSTLIGMTIF